jgi:hypothetical protein
MAFQLMDRVRWTDTGMGTCDATVIGIPKTMPFMFSYLIGWEDHENHLGLGWLIKDRTQKELEMNHTLSSDITFPPIRFVRARWVDDKCLDLISHGKQQASQASIKASAGLNCKGCNNYFPFAEAKPDGTFVCWTCKRYPFYK